MDDFLTDQQQAARVRGWIREYVPAAVLAVAVGAGGYFGYAKWQDHQAMKSIEASDLYEQFKAALEASDPELAGELRQRLATEFAGSGYADHARLRMAREYVDTSQPSLAAEELREVIATTGDGDLRQLARLRLARVYLYMELPAQGLEALQGEPHAPAWKRLAEETRGDLHHALGQTEQARAAYQAALQQGGEGDASWIRLKLDHLGAARAVGEGLEKEGQADAGAEAGAAPEAEPEPEAPPGAETAADAPGTEKE